MSTGSIVAAARLRAERRLVEHLRAAGALAAPAATPIPEQRGMGSRALGRLVAAGAIRPAAAGYYLDEANYAAHRAARTRRAIAILGVLAAAAGVGVALWWASRP